MNCRDIEPLVLAERDGALSPAQLAGLSDHVASCAACRKLRTDVTTALDLLKADAASVRVPDADEAWRDLRVRLREGAKPARKRPLAPVIWLGSSLAAAAAIALAFFVTKPLPPRPSSPTAIAATPVTHPYDSSVIAGADFVEAGDPNASTIVYVDKESGWLVVWAEAPDAAAAGKSG